jgi:hypothetical protein
MESDIMEVIPLSFKLLSGEWLGNKSERWLMIAKYLSTNPVILLDEKENLVLLFRSNI